MSAPLTPADRKQPMHARANTIADEPVHARILRYFPELVAELGGDIGEVGAMAGGIAELAGENPATTYRQFVALLNAAAETTGCRDFGMRLAIRQGGGGQYGPLGEAMRHARTLRDALEYVCDHIYAHSLAARVWLWPLETRGETFSGHDLLLGDAEDTAQAIEHLLLAGQLSALALTGGRARVARVHFRHAPLSPLQAYRRHFGCPVLFEQRNDGVVFSEGAMASAIVSPDPGAFDRVRTRIEQAFTRKRLSVQEDVRAIIMRRIGGDECSNHDIAHALGLHPRTLHRHLRDEGTSFQRVKDGVRKEILRHFVERTDLGFTRVSEKLGFAEQSVMTRSCRRWFGMSPSSMRAGHRARPSGTFVEGDDRMS